MRKYRQDNREILCEDCALDYREHNDGIVLKHHYKMDVGRHDRRCDWCREVPRTKLFEVEDKDGREESAAFPLDIGGNDE